MQEKVLRLKPNFLRNQLSKMDLMLNLPLQHSNRLAQKKQVNWLAGKTTRVSMRSIFKILFKENFALPT